MALVLSDGHDHTRVEKTTVFTEGIGAAGVKLNVWPWVHRCSMFGTCCLRGNRKRNENVDVSSDFLIFWGQGCVADVRQTSSRTACCLSVILLHPFGLMRVSRVNGAIFIQASVRTPFKPAPLAFRIAYHGVQHAIHRRSAALRQ